MVQGRTADFIPPVRSDPLNSALEINWRSWVTPWQCQKRRSREVSAADVSGESPRVICDAARLVGGTWNQEGLILFSPDFNRGLYRVSAEGGAPKLVTQPDTAQQENSHYGA